MSSLVSLMTRVRKSSLWFQHLWIEVLDPDLLNDFLMKVIAAQNGDFGLEYLLLLKGDCRLLRILAGTCFG